MTHQLVGTNREIDDFDHCHCLVHLNNGSDTAFDHKAISAINDISDDN